MKETSLEYSIDQALRMKYQVATFANKYMLEHTNKPYHNINHAIEVAENAVLLALTIGLGEYEQFILQTAGVLHDLENDFGVKEKQRISAEEQTARIATSILPTWGYSIKDAVLIGNLIRATEYIREPQTQLEKIMKDADIGGKDFIRNSEQIREELGLTKEEWIPQEVAFLQQMKWHTKAAQKHWESYRVEAIRYLKNEYKNL